MNHQVEIEFVDVKWNTSPEVLCQFQNASVRFNLNQYLYAFVTAHELQPQWYILCPIIIVMVKTIQNHSTGLLEFWLCWVEPVTRYASSSVVACRRQYGSHKNKKCINAPCFVQVLPFVRLKIRPWNSHLQRSDSSDTKVQSSTKYNMLIAEIKGTNIYLYEC